MKHEHVYGHGIMQKRIYSLKDCLSAEKIIEKNWSANWHPKYGSLRSLYLNGLVFSFFPSKRILLKQLWTDETVWNDRKKDEESLVVRRAWVVDGVVSTDEHFLVLLCGAMSDLHMSAGIWQPFCLKPADLASVFKPTVLREHMMMLLLEINKDHVAERARPLSYRCEIWACPWRRCHDGPTARSLWRERCWLFRFAEG